MKELFYNLLVCRLFKNYISNAEVMHGLQY
jgi:hypothetical protein